MSHGIIAVYTENVTISVDHPVQNYFFWKVRFELAYKIFVHTIGIKIKVYYVNTNSIRATFVYHKHILGSTLDVLRDTCFINA